MSDPDAMTRIELRVEHTVGPVAVMRSAVAEVPITSDPEHLRAIFEQLIWFVQKAQEVSDDGG